MTVPVDAWIHALQLRLRLVAPHRRTPPGEFPPGWQQWFASMPPQTGAVTGASARSVAAAMAQRPLTQPPRASDQLSRWQSLRALGRQQWHPPDADERPLRWFAALVSAGWHVFLAAVLVWLIYQQYITSSHPPPKGEEMVVQIEYIGEGTAEQVGGGPAPESGPQQNPVAADTPDASELELPVPSATPPRQVAEQPAAEVEPEPTPPAVVSVPPEPVAVQDPVEPVPAEASQPLTVSEPVADANDRFLLPPTTQRLDAPELAAPELQMSIPAIEVVDVPTPPRPNVSIMAPAQVDMPVLEQRAPDIVAREIPAPVPETPLRPLPRLPAPPVMQPTADATPRDLQAPALQTRQIPTVAAAPTRPATQQATSEPAISQTPAPTADADPLAQTTATPPGGADQADVNSTAGPEEAPAPGGWPTPERGDDWGAAARERPGKQLGEAGGLYNSDGSAKLAEVPGSAAPGQPPGAITDEIVNLDRNGTWLKRAPTDYEPTAFDEYWRPTETLLAEWVRKSVTTIRIPIPGTSKHIVCHTVLLALGGACGITDPNLVDQPASARPPPDIPFKPELQGDNGSVPAGG